ncbi:MAG: TIGR02569 family protein [Acidimicrobiales bacterium]
MTGRLVFKPVTDARLHALLASILDQIQGRDDLRIIRPVPNTDGNWSAGGWCAWEYLEGETDGSRWRDALVVSDLFHAAVAGVAHDPVVSGQHPWALADRFAWGETDIEVPRSLRDGIERLCAIRRPVDLPIQLIHGDLRGNILYHPALPPAVIDISPYWRPKPYADAIAVVDAIAWAGADLSALDAIGPDAEQMACRALLFRLGSAALIASGHPVRMAAEATAYGPVVEALCSSR